MMSKGVRAAGVGIGLLLAVSGASSVAYAQSRPPSPDELKAARELFQEAYRDEQDKRFAQALEKFQRVAAVKESSSVRYRIGTVLASLGRLREARDVFRALAGSRSSLPANEQEVADSAAERAQALDKRIPRLVVQLQDNPPPDARVTIDGAPIPASVTARPFEIDPGEHLVQATAPTAQASETRVVLQEGSEVAVTVVLPLKVGKLKPVLPPSAEPDASPRRDNTLAFVAVGAGGVLLVTGFVLLVAREGDISDLNKACRDVCPSSNRAALEAKRDEAQLFGPLGVGFGVVGLAAAGAGAYLLLRASPRPSAHGTTASTPTSGLRVGPSAVRGGAALGVFGTF